MSITKNPIGYLDASKEIESLPHHFIKTSNYETILNSDILFICGRKGEGKTALALMIKLEKDTKNIFRYEYNILIRNYEFYHSMAIDLRENILSYKTDYNSQIKEKIDVKDYFEQLWNYVFYISAFNSVLKNCENYKEIEKIREFLSTHNLIVEDDKIANILVNIVKQDLIDGPIIEPIAITSILRIKDRIENASFIGAKESLYKHLKKNKYDVIIIIDTLEKYYFKEDELVKAVQGMMVAVYNFKINPQNKRIDVKCFLPTELYETFSSWNPSKVLDGTVFLKWSYKELLFMITKRYITYLKNEHLKFYNDNDLDKIEVDWNNKDSVRNNIWNRFFPECILDLYGAQEDSFNYILRDTQRKPREVIHILNKIIYHAELNGNSPWIKKEDIKEGVHQDLKQLVRDNSFAHHEKINDFIKIIQMSFENESNILTGKDVIKCLKRGLPSYSSLGLELNEVVQILLRSSLIGIVPKKNIITRTLSNGNEIFVYNTIFEYLVNYQLSINDKSLCALHSILTDSIPTLNIQKDICIYPLAGHQDDIEIDELHI